MNKIYLDIRRTHRSGRQLETKSRSDLVVVRRPRGSTPEIPQREQQISFSNSQLRTLIGEIEPQELEIIRRLAYKARLNISARFRNEADHTEFRTNPIEPTRAAPFG